MNIGIHIGRKKSKLLPVGMPKMQKLYEKQSAIAFFLLLNILRILLLKGSGDDGYFQADYALPPILIWIFERIRFPSTLAWVVVFSFITFILIGDALTVESLQFHWGLESVPGFII